VNQIPKVTVKRHDGGWLAACEAQGCGFAFWHIRRHVVDEQATAHQRTDHRKRGRA
jgi:hypothetical protein